MPSAAGLLNSARTCAAKPLVGDIPAVIKPRGVFNGVGASEVPLLWVRQGVVIVLLRRDDVFPTRSLAVLKVVGGQTPL